MKKLFLFLCSFAILCGCSPKVTSHLSTARPPLDASADVIVLGLNTLEPVGAVNLGSVTIGDTGFTTPENGTYDKVITLAKEQARNAGGNAIRIRRHQPADARCTTHRIQADILWIDDPEALDPASLAKPKEEHPDCAIIYFYRFSGYGLLVQYDVNIGDTVVFRAKPNAAAEVRIYEPRQYEIWAHTEAKASRMINIKLGEDYYVRCDVGMGAFVGRPQLEIVPEDTGRPEYESLTVKE